MDLEYDNTPELKKDMDEFVCCVSDEVTDAIHDYPREEVLEYLNAALSGFGFCVSDFRSKVNKA